MDFPQHTCLFMDMMIVYKLLTMVDPIHIVFLYLNLVHALILLGMNYLKNLKEMTVQKDQLLVNLCNTKIFFEFGNKIKIACSYNKFKIDRSYWPTFKLYVC